MTDKGENTDKSSTCSLLLCWRPGLAPLHQALPLLHLALSGRSSSDAARWCAPSPSRFNGGAIGITPQQWLESSRLCLGSLGTSPPPHRLLIDGPVFRPACPVFDPEVPQSQSVSRRRHRYALWLQGLWERSRGAVGRGFCVGCTFTTATEPQWMTGVCGTQPSCLPKPLSLG